jgi:DNA-binding NarL/FixJ family response regulator
MASTTRLPGTAIVVDPFPLYLVALERLLTDAQIEVLLATSSPTEAFELVRRRRPNLLLAGLEVEDGDLDGLGLVRHTVEITDDVKVVAVSESPDRRAAAEALGAGASAYVVRTAHPADFMSAIRQVFEPSLYLAAPQTFGALPAADPDDVQRLTKRELEILQHAAEGQSNAEIARILWVTEQTVKFHLSNVYRKLGVGNRTEASRWAQRNGLLTLDSERAQRIPTPA